MNVKKKKAHLRHIDVHPLLNYKEDEKNNKRRALAPCRRMSKRREQGLLMIRKLALGDACCGSGEEVEVAENIDNVKRTSVVGDDALVANEFVGAASAHADTKSNLIKMIH